VEGRSGETTVSKAAITAHARSGPRTESFRPAAGLYLAADIRLPQVTFERAGTRVAARVVVLEKQTDAAMAPQQVNRDYSDSDDIKDFFERIEGSSIPRRNKPEPVAPVTGKAGKADDAKPEGKKLVTDAEEITYTTKKGKVLQGVIAKGLTEAQAKEYDPYTWKKDGGYFIRMEHVERPGASGTAMFEPAAVYTVSEDGQTYDTDLFGNPLPDQNRKRDKAADRGVIRAATSISSEPGDIPGTYQVRTALVTEQDRTIGVNRVITPEDAARALGYLSNKAVEHFDALVTDKNGKPLAIIGAFKGTISQASVYPQTLVAEAIRIPGAAEIWMAHNHPSGTPVPSAADRNLTEQVKQVFSGTGIEVVESLVIAGPADRRLASGIMNGMRGEPVKKPDSSIKVPVVELSITEDQDNRAAVSSPDVAKGVYAATKESGVLFLDSQNKVAGFYPIQNWDSLLTDGRLAELYRAMSMSNASGAMIFDKGTLPNNKIRNVANALARVDVRMLDVLHDAWGGVASWTEKGKTINDGAPLFSRNNSQNTKLKKLKDAAVDVQNKFRNADTRRQLREEDVDAYFALSSALSDTKDAFAEALDQLPEEGFALQGKLGDGRLLLLTPSVKTQGQYQITRFDDNGNPWGDSAYSTRIEAIRDFLREANLETVTDYDVKFSRNTTGTGIATDTLNTIVSRIQKNLANLPNVRVLASPEALDRADASQARLYDHIQSAGALNDAEGAMHDGEIYLFASGIADEARAEHVLATHEVTHYGLRAVFGAELDPVLQSIWANNASVRKQAQALREKLKLKSNTVAVEEVLADMKPADLVKLKGWRKLAGVMRDWFRSHGFTALAGKLDGLMKAGMTEQQQVDMLVADVVNAARDWVKGGKRAAKTGSGTMLQRVWHGGPHLWAAEPGFPHGRPRLDKMGTGEGAQAFGWGWYSAESHGVAKSYKEALASDNGKTFSVGGVLAEHTSSSMSLYPLTKALKSFGVDGIVASNVVSALDVTGDIEKAKAYIARVWKADAKEHIDALSHVKQERKGSLYQLDIPDATLPYLLDWDKPLSEQTKEVREAIKKADFLVGKKRFSEILAEYGDTAAVLRQSGKWFYEAITAANPSAAKDNGWSSVAQTMNDVSGSPKAASEYLASLGIVGNRYLDGQSRKDGAGSFNYVIWDQGTLDKIAMLERNGEKLDAMRGADARLSRASQSNIPGVSQSPPVQPPSQQAMPLQGGAAGNQSVFNTPEPLKTDDIIFKLQDKHIDLKRVTQGIKDAGRQIDDKWNAYQNEELFHERAAKRVKDFNNKELTKMLDDMVIRKVSIADLDQYLWARHAKEANALIEQRDPGVMVDDVTGKPKGSGMTDQEADDYFAGLSTDQRNQLAAIARQVDSMIARTRDLYVSYGLESRDTVQGWADMFQHYVPLMREDHDGGMGIGQGFSIKGREAKHRTGSTGAVADVLANIVMQREKAIVRGEKNRVAVSLAGLVKLNPAPDFWSLDKIPQERVQNEKTGMVETREVPNYRTRDNVIIAKIKDSNGNVRERAIVMNEHDERAVRLAKTMKNIDIPMLEGWLGAAAVVTRYFSAINTQYNPVFGVINLIRDVGAAALNLSSTALKGKEVVVTNPKRIASAVAGIYSDARKERKGQIGTSPWAQLWEDFTEQGGSTGYRDMYRTSNDRADAMQMVMDPTSWTESKWGQFFTAKGTLKVPLLTVQKAATPLFQWLSDYNLAMENAVRLSAYKEALDSGMSKPQAASLAKNLTVNFNRKGAWGAQAGALYAFFNAATQGTARIGETLTRRDYTTGKYSVSGIGKKIIGGGVMLGVMQAVALAMAGFDDDEPPEFIRERNIVIPVPFGTAGAKKYKGKDGAWHYYITIPMPLGFHVIPNIGRIATETLMGRRGSATEAAIDLMGITFDAFNPMGSAGWSMQTVVPTILDPIAAIIENKDWAGKPIAKEKFSNSDPTPGFAMAKDNASAISTGIAYAINMATGGTDYTAGRVSPTPDQLDYLWGQVTGGVGREGNKLYQTIESLFTGEELPPHKIPLFGRLYGNTQSKSAISSRFYENVRDMKKHKAEYMGRLEDGDSDGAQAYLEANPDAAMIGMVTAYESRLQKLRSIKRKTDDPEQVKMIEELTSELMGQFNQQMESAKQQVVGESAQRP
jgi:hypothetical protein